jgi:hypothetical protein
MRRTGHEGPDYYGLAIVCGGESEKPVAAAERRPRESPWPLRNDDREKARGRCGTTTASGRCQHPSR